MKMLKGNLINSSTILFIVGNVICPFIFYYKGISLNWNFVGSCAIVRV
jgi:hypothetical protein